MSNEYFKIDLPGYAPLEVLLTQPDDFLKVRETLTRIGVASRKDKILFQSCHILHKQGKYYIVHFKELFALDGKQTDLTENDIERRNTIAKLLSDWELVKIIVIAYKDKHEWDLQTKYNIGNKRINSNDQTYK